MVEDSVGQVSVTPAAEVKNDANDKNEVHCGLHEWFSLFEQLLVMWGHACVQGINVGVPT